jgi:hypothetical protein
MAAHLLVGTDELRAVPGGEAAPGLLIDIRACAQAETDIPVSLGVHIRNRACANHSDVHQRLF